MPGTKIAVVQMESKLGKPAQNLRRAEHYIHEAVAQGADLICLPEAFSTSGNILEVADVSVTVPGPETDFLREQAKQAGVHIVAGLLERGDDGKYYSTSVLCGPEEPCSATTGACTATNWRPATSAEDPSTPSSTSSSGASA